MEGGADENRAEAGKSQRRREWCAEAARVLSFGRRARRAPSGPTEFAGLTLHTSTVRRLDFASRWRLAVGVQYAVESHCVVLCE